MDVGAKARRHDPRQPGQERDDRAQEPADHIHRPGQDDREAVGVGEGQRLGHQLGEDDREGRKQDRDHDQRGAPGDLVQHRHVPEEALQPSHEVDGRVGGGQEADEGYRYLNHGQEAARIGRQSFDQPGAPPAFVDQLIDTAGPDRNQGDLGGDEDRLDQDEDEDYQ